MQCYERKHKANHGYTGREATKSLEDGAIAELLKSYSMQGKVLESGLIKKNNIIEALSYLDNVLDKVNLPVIVETGRPDIDSILNFKIFKEKQYDIKIEHKIAVPTEIAIKDYNMVIILGNLLDNAIDAVKNLPFEERIIKIHIRYDRLRLSIQTKNRQVRFLIRQCRKFQIPFYVLKERDLKMDYFLKYGENRVCTIPFWSLDENGKKGKMMRHCTIDYKIVQMQNFVR